MELNYYEYEHNEYIPPHPTLNWKKIFSDFLKYVIVPILFFFFAVLDNLVVILNKTPQI